MTVVKTGTQDETATDKGGATPVEDMSLLSITDGENARGIPFVKFIDDVEAFANSFSPPASAEILIGAYSELHSKFKTFETSLTQKSKSELMIGQRRPSFKVGEGRIRSGTRPFPAFNLSIFQSKGSFADTKTLVVILIWQSKTTNKSSRISKSHYP